MTTGTTPADFTALRDQAKKKFDAAIDENYRKLLTYKLTGDVDAALRFVRMFENFNALNYKDMTSVAKQVHTSDALRRLQKIPSTDIKSLAAIYSELSGLNPQNAEYTTEAAKYADKLKQQADELKRQQVLQEERDKEAAVQRSVENAKQAKIDSRKKSISDQFSPWDGSHRLLERIIKKSMNDPDSYQHVESTYSDKGDYILVQTTFRGKNAFGGVVKNWVQAKFSLDGELLGIVAQGP